MKKNKMIIPALALIGALVLLSTVGAVQQSDNSSADVTYVMTISTTAGGTVEYNLNDAGFVTYTAPVPITPGSSLVVKPVAASGFVFYKWGAPTNLFSPTLTWNSVSGPVSLNAQFVDETTAPAKKIITLTGNNVTWTVGGDSGGGVQFENTFAFFPGTVITLTATPFIGFTGPITIKVDGAPYTAGTNFTVVNDATFNATGATPSVPKYTVTLNKVGNGTVEGAGTFDAGTSVTIKAIAGEGYEFKGWSDGNTNATRTLEVIANVTLTATFEEVPVTTDDGGSSFIIYAVVGVVVLLAIGVIMWLFWFRKP